MNAEGRLRSKLITSFANIALCISVFAVLFPLALPIVTAVPWHVYPGPGTPIQNAIDAANPGDTIYVHEGTYNEVNITVWKTLTIVGDSKTNTILDPQGQSTVITISASWVKVTGFTIKNGEAG
jgi:hypothetical protein